METSEDSEGKDLQGRRRDVPAQQSAGSQPAEGSVRYKRKMFFLLPSCPPKKTFFPFHLTHRKGDLADKFLEQQPHHRELNDQRSLPLYMHQDVKKDIELPFKCPTETYCSETLDIHLMRSCVIFIHGLISKPFPFASKNGDTKRNIYIGKIK